MFIQYQQRCFAFVQSTVIRIIVRDTKRYGGMAVFLSRIRKYTYFNLGPDIGDIGWGFSELPCYLKGRC